MPHERLSCREAMDFLDSYVSGAIAPETRVRFEAHLTACRDCRAYLDAYRTTVRIARAAHDCDDAASVMPDELLRAILAARKGKSP